MRRNGAVTAILLLTIIAPVRFADTRAGADTRAVGDVFREVSASVVVVRAKGRDVGASGTTRYTETGSGVLASADGKIITAAHVVHATDELTVEFFGATAVPAKVISTEPAADLALLRLDRVPPGARVATLADSDSVRVGDQIIIIGAPYGLGHSMSVGWISARWPANTVYRAMPLAEFLQTDATINTGNSGGPMFDMQGRVIGIVSHNISKSGGSDGLGFVITSNTARQLLLEAPSFWSGLDGRMISGRVAEILNVPQPDSYLVKTVARGSLADAAGLRGGSGLATILGESLAVGGDIVLRVDGVVIDGTDAMVRIRERLRTRSPGTEFTVTVLRLGRVVDLKGKVP
jgi:S1-C subfamily serine protease